jgi:hypothetical protein
MKGRAFGESESSQQVKLELLVQVDGVNNIPNGEDGDKKLVMGSSGNKLPVGDQGANSVLGATHNIEGSA